MACRGSRDVHAWSSRSSAACACARAIPWLVGLVIIAAYWFTASTSFANPAVTLAREFTTTFAGIAINHVPAFILAQLFGACLGAAVASVLFRAAGPVPVDTKLGEKSSLHERGRAG